MVVTSDDAFATRVRMLRTHGGRRTGGRFQFDDVGFNYRLSDILAAVGLAQLRRFGGIVARRREIAADYDRRLRGMAGVQTPSPDPGHVYQSYVLLLDQSIDRDRVIAAMAAEGIETTLGTYAVHAQPAMSSRYGYSAGDRPASWRAYRSSLTLPLHGRMTDHDLDRVCGTLERAVNSA
jgi:dTDP-4-amino-4,6-dideoxygalactose transaminase